MATNNSRLTPTQYAAAARKFAASYAALEALYDGADTGERIALSRAMGALRVAAGQLPVRVCTACNRRGLVDAPGQPGGVRACDHPNVKTIDIRES